MTARPGVAAAALALLLAAPARAGEPLVLAFEGRVEPARSVIVANHLDGIVERVLFAGGERVEAGQVLVEMDAKSLRVALDAARAERDIAGADLALAADRATRQARLRERGTGSEVAAFEAAIEHRRAAAALALAEARVAEAALALDRASVEAPIAGRVGPPLVAPGAFVEAEAGSALAEIAETDPVLVAYAVPYEARMRALAATGAADVAALFERVTVEIVLPDGTAHPHPGRPRFESMAIDPESGALTTWAEVANPDGALVPGLAVGVRSRVATGVDATRAPRAGAARP